MIDFEFFVPPGERPSPLCLVARSLRGEVRRLWLEGEPSAAPFEVGPRTLFVAYYASAEVGCFLALGWPEPAHILDLFAEFRVLTNGRTLDLGSGLVGALAYFNLTWTSTEDKEDMRALAMRGGPFTESEKRRLLDYCEADVNGTAQLLAAMRDKIDVPRAILRGRYMRAAAHMEHTGVPIEVPTLTRIRSEWDGIKDRLVRAVDAQFGVFEGSTFKAQRWAEWLARRNIPWPRRESGALALDDDTFRDMARAHPAVATIRELRHSLSELRLNDLAVGHDGRNRTLLSAFRAKTSRNQPSNSKFIFGPSVWLRGLIRPEPGRGLAYVDWSQQEFGIAAALSSDERMIDAYVTGDPYLAFAKQAGAVPKDATKATHGAAREQFKACVLAVQYGMGEASLAQRIGRPVPEARELLRLHRRTYPRFWAWSDAAVHHALLLGRLSTVFGWPIHLTSTRNIRALQNFPMQANGAEMLRLACSYLTEDGINVCAPVHDAVLVEGPLDELDDVVRRTQAHMAAASAVVLGGLKLRSEAKTLRPPERYMDPRGHRMWSTVQAILDDV